ncbi:MAG: hypothetical protein RLZZ15_3390 [Verrucomicrobiota bacterium]|jgi:hypothetical protein
MNSSDSPPAGSAPSGSTAPNLLPGTTPGLAAAPKVKTEGISLLQGSLPRLLGYGLLGLFALDVLQLLANYKWFNPEADSTLASQMIERVGVPIVAYALIFGVNNVAAHRFERTVLKLLSIGALVGAVLYAGLTALVVSSAIRLHTRAAATISFQENTRVTGLEEGGKKLDSMPPGQLAAVQRQLLPDLKIAGNETPAQLAATIRRELPKTIKSVHDAADASRAALRKQIYVGGAKYFFGGVLSAVICLVAWENTRSARRHHIFRPKAAPSMQIEDRAADAIRRVQRSAEDALAMHVLERFRWYRKLRRFFTGKHGKH